MELSFAYGENRVRNEQIRIEMRGNREGKTDVHPTRITLDWCVDELCELRELDDLIETVRHFVPRHAEHRPLEENVVTAGQITVEAGADLDQARHATAQFDFAFRGLRDAREDLQQRRLSRAVSTYDAEHLAA